jgi:hypothetical protein
LLLSAADTLDNASKTIRNSQRRQQLYSSNTTYDTEDVDVQIDDDNSYDIDTYICNMTSRTPPYQAQNPRVHTSNMQQQQRAFIPRKMWMHIPEYIRRFLTTNNGNPTTMSNTGSSAPHSTNMMLFDDVTSHDTSTCTDIVLNQDVSPLEISNTVLSVSIINQTRLTDDRVHQVINNHNYQNLSTNYNDTNT